MNYPGDEFFVKAVGEPLEADYAAAGQALNAGSVVWIARTIWRTVHEGMSIEESVAKSQAEWRAALNPAASKHPELEMPDIQIGEPPR